MILSSHIVTASVMAAPLAAQPFNLISIFFIFFISFASHYILDSIPHWDYSLSSFVKVFNKDGVYRGERKFIFQKSLLIKDLIKILLDFFVGLLIIFLFIGFSNNFDKILITGLIIFASSLPDILQVCYAFLKHSRPKILELERKFHHYIHGERIFENQPILGFISQILTLLVVIVILRYLFDFLFNLQ